MERINRIIEHETYRRCLSDIKCLEKDRIFCGHDMGHFLDVARLAYILDLEEDIGIDRELIYAAALLHDIGRHLQYRQGIPHEQASVQLAAEILKDCGFSEEEVQQITEAIVQHRNANVREQRTLSGLLYRSDKLSRSCFSCSAERECDWEKQKKNLGIYR